MSNFKIDPQHSEILFKVKHLMITNVSGTFGEFDAIMHSSTEDFSDAVISFSANTSTINTHNTQRDNHLRSGDFFESEQYPTLQFQSASIEKKGDEHFILNGDITIKSVTQPISLAVEYTGKMTDPYGQEKFGFEITGKLNRKDFGLNWSAVTDAGGIVVSDEVKLLMSIQMVKQ